MLMLQRRSRASRGYSITGNEVAFDVCKPLASLKRVKTDT